MTEIFKRILDGWMPKAVTDKKYKMFASVQLVLDAMIAMSSD